MWLQRPSKTWVLTRLRRVPWAWRRLMTDSHRYRSIGWTQMLVYRKDLFAEKGLAPPNTYANAIAAIEALHNPPEMFGFVAATKVDENFMSQVLEHVFLANGVIPVDETGFAPLDEAATTEVLDFYKALAAASPPGEVYWK